jgi:hypothetical protein
MNHENLYEVKMDFADDLVFHDRISMWLWAVNCDLSLPMMCVETGCVVFMKFALDFAKRLQFSIPSDQLVDCKLCREGLANAGDGLCSSRFDAGLRVRYSG